MSGDGPTGEGDTIKADVEEAFTGSGADIKHGELFESGRSNFVEERTLQRVGIAHPAINELQLADAILVFGRRVISRVDVFELVATALKLFEH